MYTALQSSHSGLRWILLVLLVAAIIQAFTSKPTKGLALGTLIITHVQFLLGLGLYFGLSPKVSFSEGWMGNSSLRFFGMEHFLLMLIAVTLITIGYRKFKSNKFGAYKWLLLVALIIMLAGIPWPFREGLG